VRWGCSQNVFHAYHCCFQDVQRFTTTCNLYLIRLKRLLLGRKLCTTFPTLSFVNALQLGMVSLHEGTPFQIHYLTLQNTALMTRLEFFNCPISSLLVLTLLFLPSMIPSPCLVMLIVLRCPIYIWDTRDATFSLHLPHPCLSLCMTSGCSASVVHLEHLL
jgi:hypothetical protein